MLEVCNLQRMSGIHKDRLHGCCKILRHGIYFSVRPVEKKKLSNIFLKYTTNHIINSSRYAQVYNPRISHEEFPCKFNPRGTQSKHK